MPTQQTYTSTSSSQIMPSVGDMGDYATVESISGALPIVETITNGDVDHVIDFSSSLNNTIIAYGTNIDSLWTDINTEVGDYNTLLQLSNHHIVSQKTYAFHVAMTLPSTGYSILDWTVSNITGASYTITGNNTSGNSFHNNILQLNITGIPDLKKANIQIVIDSQNYEVDILEVHSSYAKLEITDLGLPVTNNTLSLGGSLSIDFVLEW